MLIHENWQRAAGGILVDTSPLKARTDDGGAQQCANSGQAYSSNTMSSHRTGTDQSLSSGGAEGHASHSK